MNDNPFRTLSLAQMYAWLFKNHGEEGLRYFLSREAHDRVCAHKGVYRPYPVGWRESCEEASEELEALGLDVSARILADHAKQLPSLHEHLGWPVRKARNSISRN